MINHKVLNLKKRTIILDHQFTRIKAVKLKFLQNIEIHLLFKNTHNQKKIMKPDFNASFIRKWILSSNSSKFSNNNSNSNSSNIMLEDPPCQSITILNVEEIILMNFTIRNLWIIWSKILRNIKISTLKL